MITTLIIAFFTLSTVVSLALISACIMAGRSQTDQMCDVEVLPSIAEMPQPKVQLQTSLTAQQPKLTM